MVGLALLFATAAFHKFRDLRRFTLVLTAYRVIPEGPARRLAWSIPCAELAVALALAWPPARRLDGHDDMYYKIKAGRVVGGVEVRVIAEGAVMAGAGVVAGALLGYVLARVAGGYIPDIRMPSTLPVIASALVLLTAAVVASVLPAARAARVDVIQALRSE